jgi:hypothetical protein
MKQTESTPPLANNATMPSLSPQQMQDVQRANREANSQANKDLSFLTVLASSHLKLDPLVSLDALSDTSIEDTSSDDNKTSAPAKASESKKANAASDSSTSTQAVSQSQDNKEVKDALDMLNTDLSKIPSTDISVLLRLTQGTPAQIPMVQNLSPSLIDSMPTTHYTSLNVSKGLQDLLDNAYKTQRPVRIAISDNAAMILRLARDGRVSAEFLPNNQAAEAYFRQNMLELQNRLESKQLPYGTLSVRDWQQQQKQQQQQQQ